MTEETVPESFESFKNSFSYGSRTDLNFKFLKGLDPAAAAAFFQELLWRIGDAYDGGDWSRFIDHVREGQRQVYDRPTTWSYDEAPFTPGKPAAESKIALLTSSGHFVAGQDPRPFGVENMTQDEAIARIDDFLKAEPELSAIPSDTPEADLRVRHGGYDIRGAQADPNVVLPLTRLRELADAGRIGQLASHVYSFVGAAAQSRILRHSAPRWLAQFQAEGIEGVLLVPV